MKAIIILGLLWSLNSFAKSNCIDFSGSYRLNNEFSEEPITLKIDQTDCEKIQLNYYDDNKLTGSEVFELNNKKVKLREFSDIGLVIYATPYFKENDIVIDLENKWSDGKSDFFKRRFHLEFSTSIHLLDQRGDFRADGPFVPSSQTEYIRE